MSYLFGYYFRLLKLGQKQIYSQNQNILMDSVYCVCDCLLFRLKHKNYLYRITPQLIHEMPENQIFIKSYKFTPDFIILPSQPYHLRMESFGWFIPFQIKNSISILIKDSKVRKTIQSNFDEISKQGTKWQLWNDVQIPQNQLLEKLEKLYNQDNFGKKINFNHPLFQRSYKKLDPMIFTYYLPQISQASVLCHNGKVLAIDPDVNFFQIMKQNDIKEQRLTSILVTGTHQKNNYMQCRVFRVFLGWFRYLVKGYKPELIMTQPNYELFKKWLKSLFFLGERVWINYPIKILGANFKYKLPFIGTIQFADDLQINQTYTIEIPSLIDIKNKKIGQNTKIRFYSSILKFIPQSLGDLTFAVVYQIGKHMRQKLHQSPKLLREKIIYNRQRHKYNHKYFCRLNTQHNFFEFCTHNKIRPSAYSTNQLYNQYITKVNPQKIEQNKIVNCAERAFFVNAGKILDEQDQIIYPGTISLQGNLQLLKVMTNIYDIQIIGFRQLHMLNQIKSIEENLYLEKKQSNLEQIQKDNTFLKGLSKQQLQQLEMIVTAETLQAGQKLNISHHKAGYFVIKGGLKIAGSELVAGKNHFIGNIRPAIQETVWEGIIDVVRDSWVLKVPLLYFAAFLGNYPDKLIEFLSYGLIFS